jgi:hypothetical protein
MKYKKFLKDIDDNEIQTFQIQTGKTVYAHVYKDRINFLSEGMKKYESMYYIKLKDAKKIVDIFCAINLNYTYLSALYWNTKCGSIRKVKDEKKKEDLINKIKMHHNKRLSKSKIKNKTVPTEVTV